MIKPIKQQKPNQGDCGVACVAMITQRSYSEIERAFIENGLVKNENYYTFHKDLIFLLKKMRYSVKRKRFKSWAEVLTPSIVKINLSKDNYWHWVVLIEENGKKIMLDPKPKAPNKITSFRGKRGVGQYLFIE